MEIIFLIIGLVIGAFASWFIASFKFKGETNVIEERRKNLQVKFDKQEEDIENLQNKFKDTFINLANDIFDRKTKDFSTQSKNNLDQILSPFNEKLKDLEKKVEETYDKESKERFSLAKEIKGLQELNLQMSKDATNLTNALKGDSKTMGNWGEVILESILEKSGLVKDREFFIQESHLSDDGKRLQPDVIVKLPENRNIIIDSKVSLVAYDRYCSIEDEKERANELKSHISSLRNHINNLSAKNYQSIYGLESLDFVIMFLPIEPAYSLAAQNDWTLVNEATEKNIVLISPSILLIALKTIASLWRREFQNRNAFEIAKKSGALLDKFKLFVDDLISVGNNLRTTKDNYDKAMNKLVDGKGNLVSRTEKIRELGAKATKSLPKNIIDRALDEEGDS
jgi:DNA recombination protein RmuC